MGFQGRVPRQEELVKKEEEVAVEIARVHVHLDSVVLERRILVHFGDFLGSSGCRV